MVAKRARTRSAAPRDQVDGRLRIRSFELEAEGDAVGRLMRVGVRRFALSFAWGGQTPGAAAMAALGDVAAELLGAAMASAAAPRVHPSRKRPAERKRRSAGAISGERLPSVKGDPEMVRLQRLKDFVAKP